MYMTYMEGKVVCPFCLAEAWLKNTSKRSNGDLGKHSLPAHLWAARKVVTQPSSLGDKHKNKVVYLRISMLWKRPPAISFWLQLWWLGSTAGIFRGKKSSLHFSLHQPAHGIFHLLPCWIFSRLMWASATRNPDGSFLESASVSFHSLFTEAALKRMLPVGSAGGTGRIGFPRRWDSQALSRKKKGKWGPKVSVGILNSLSLGKDAMRRNIAEPWFFVDLSCVSGYLLEREADW